MSPSQFDKIQELEILSLYQNFLGDVQKIIQDIGLSELTAFITYAWGPDEDRNEKLQMIVKKFKLTLTS